MTTTIAGSVFEDLNGNGVVDAGEGIPNVTVFLDTDGDGLPTDVDAITLTDGAGFGFFSFDGLPAGTFDLNIVTPPGATQPTVVPASITVDGIVEDGDGDGFDDNPALINIPVVGATAPPAPAPVFFTGNVQGVAFGDNNSDGIYDPTSEPTFAGVEVGLDINNDGEIGPGEPSVLTNEAGFYDINAVLPGSFIKRVLEPGDFESTTPNPEVIAVTAGVTTFTPEGLVIPDSVYGFVIEDLNGNGFPEANEPGIEGVTVSIPGEGSDTTDEDGFYVIDGLDTEVGGGDNPQNPFDQFVNDNPGEFEDLFGGFTVEVDAPTNAFLITSPVPPEVDTPGVFGLPVGPGQSAQVNFTLVTNVVGGGAGTIPNSITGVVFEDANANGFLDFDPVTGGGESNLAGVDLFLDLDVDGELDEGEPVTVSDEFGNFAFFNVPPSTYVLRAESPDGLDNLTTPVPAITTNLNEAAVFAVGFSDTAPTQPTNPFALPGEDGGIDPDALVPVTSLPVIAPAPVAPII
ncbi:MAG: SdrD B-like domain-containing protein [Microcoleaceae cyanobacterium]